MSGRLFRIAGFVLMTVVAFGTGGRARAGFIARDSADFPYYYEMDVAPSTLDRDGNSVLDFTYGKTSPGSCSVLDGVLTISSTGSSTAAYYECTAIDQIWANKISYANGWTMEFSAWTPSGSGTPFGIHFRPIGTVKYGTLYMSVLGESWNNGSTTPLSTTDVNSDSVFHTFRIAQAPNSDTCSVWRDGVLLSDSLALGGSETSSSFFFGDGSSVTKGTTYVDYVRLISGAFAPVPEPSAITLAASALAGLLAYAWRKRS